MIIDHIETIRADTWMIVVIGTDTGLVGVGEAGLWALPDSVAATIAALREGLLKTDPLQMEHKWQSAYRFSHFRSASLTAALSAIDIALWDIAGQHFGAPIYSLMGGKVRDRVRLYFHIFGNDRDELAAAAKAAVAGGYTAVRFDPFRGTWPRLRHPRMIEDAAARVRAVRDEVGADIDVCIECHFKLNGGEAVAFGRAIADQNVLFVEDPVQPESPARVANVARSMGVPIATGERLQLLPEFRDLMRDDAVTYIRPDICLAGGFTQVRKIAAIAEAAGIGVIPHNWLSPICTAACIQLGAALPNFVIQEATDETAPPKAGVLRDAIRIEGGYAVVPDGPGLGVTADLDYLRQLTPRQVRLESPQREDGTVVDH